MVMKMELLCLPSSPIRPACSCARSVGRGNILWFRLFNGSWILFLSIMVICMPYFNKHKEALDEP